MNPDPDDVRLPKRLRDDLSRVYRKDVPGSPEVDRLVLNRARAHLAGRNRFRLLLRSGGAAAAVAAVVLIAFALWPSPDPRPQVQVAATPPAVTRPTAGDANGDGVVDIRDALVLARRIESAPASAVARPQDDVNGDAAVDRRDVDAIAMLAVRLEPEVVR